MKKRHLYYILLVFLFSAAFVAGEVMHSGSNFMMSVDGGSSSLQSAVSAGYLKKGTSHTYNQPASVSEIGHVISQIWVSVKGVENNLLEMLKTSNRLCPGSIVPTKSYSGPTASSYISKGYHYSNEIQVTLAEGTMTLQEAIDNRYFCGSADVCVPNCAGKECGDNECLGSCGTCSSGNCVNGKCSSVANHPPVITSTPVTSVNENAEYRYAVKATDADGDAITFSLLKPAPPTWLRIVRPDTGIISGTAPEVGSDTNYEVEVKASDGKASVTQKYTLGVKNVAPSCTHGSCGARVCGTIANGTCSGTIDCGNCSSTEVCINGICQTKTCTDCDCSDTDGGNNAFVKGTIRSGTWSATDYCYLQDKSLTINGAVASCISNSTNYCSVYEYYCTANDLTALISTPCTYGCNDGKCVPAGPQEPCTPDCAGKTCGPDNCGNSAGCGKCGTGYVCSPSYQCLQVGSSCYPAGADSTCVNPGTISSSGICTGSGYKPKGTTPCGGTEGKACDGEGVCVGWSGDGCGNCPFGTTGSIRSGDKMEKCKLSDGYIGRDQQYDDELWELWITYSDPTCRKCTFAIFGIGCANSKKIKWEIKPL
jgi:hypothetical protein